MSRGKVPPRYVRLYESLRSGIASGVYPVGTLLPTEAELGAEYGVSRHTVREATRRLVDAGMISRHPSVGTIVKSSTPRSMPLYIAGLGSVQDLMAYTELTRLEPFSHALVKASPEMSERFQCDTDSVWLRIKACRHLVADNTKLSCSYVYLRPEFEGIRKNLTGNHVSIYRQLQNDYGQTINRIQQHIEAAPMPAEAKAHLDISEEEPALRMLRAYFDSDNGLLAISDNFYIASRFQLSTEWVGASS